MFFVLKLNNLEISLYDYELVKEEKERERGLSELVRLCFGKPLNKSGIFLYTTIKIIN